MHLHDLIATQEGGDFTVFLEKKGLFSSQSVSKDLAIGHPLTLIYDVPTSDILAWSLFLQNLLQSDLINFF